MKARASLLLVIATDSSSAINVETNQTTRTTTGAARTYQGAMSRPCLPD